MAAQAICLEGRLALDLYPLDTVPDAEIIAQSQIHNHDCLKQAMLIDELSHPGCDDHSSEVGDHGRLEKKLDLLFSLVKSLIEKQNTSVMITQVKLTTDVVEWQCDEPDCEESMLMQLFLQPGSLLPMHLYLKKVSHHGGFCHARVLHMSEAVREQLEKYIFLRHRRKIAAQKNTAV